MEKLWNNITRHIMTFFWDLTLPTYLPNIGGGGHISKCWDLNIHSHKNLKALLMLAL